MLAAAALTATALHKSGRKKEAASAVTELIGAVQRAEDQHVQDELGAPLELFVSLLVAMHRTKEALRLLSQLLSRVSGPRHRPFFSAIGRACPGQMRWIDAEVWRSTYRH